MFIPNNSWSVYYPCYSSPKPICFSCDIHNFLVVGCLLGNFTGVGYVIQPRHNFMFCIKNFDKKGMSGCKSVAECLYDKY